MQPKKFAFISGLVLLIVGVLALIPALSTVTGDLIPLNVDESYGWFLGIFPMNIVTKTVMIAIGAWGLSATRSETRGLPDSIRYARWVFVITGLGTVLGLIPATQTLGGTWPLYGAEVPLHGVIAIFAAYFGFTLTAKATQENNARFGSKLPDSESERARHRAA